MTEKVIRPFAKQREATRVARQNLATLYGGAVRGGKSYWLLLLFYSLAEAFPNSRWIILRANRVIIEATILKSWYQLLSDGLSGGIAYENRSKLVWRLHNGSEIMFFGEQYEQDPDLDRFRGLEANGFGIDEVNEIREKTFLKCIERAGSWQHSKGAPIIIAMTCNPTQGWVKRVFYTPWKEGKLPKGYAYVPSKIHDNEFISNEYKESLKLLPFYEYEVFVNGNWDYSQKVGDEMYKCYDDSTHIIRGDTEGVHSSRYNPDLPIHMTWDFNTKPYVTTNIWQVFGKRAIKIDEILGRPPRNTNLANCEEFKRRYPTTLHKGGLIIYGDPSGLKETTAAETLVRVKEKDYNEYTQILNSLSEYHPSSRVPRAYPAVKQRVNFINSIFSSNIFDIELLFSDRCTESMLEYNNLKEASDGTKLKEKDKDEKTGVPFEKWGHISDADDYFVTECFKKEYLEYTGLSGPINIYAGKGSKTKGIL